MTFARPVGPESPILDTAQAIAQAGAQLFTVAVSAFALAILVASLITIIRYLLDPRR